MFLGSPDNDVKVSFNWKTWGDGGRYWQPQRIPYGDQKLLDFRRCAPIGGWWKDADFYQVMANRWEVDYDQITTAVNKTSKGWLPPPINAEEIATGKQCFGLLSFGPFRLGPGMSLPFAIAVVGGEDVHHDPNAWEDLFDPYHPEWFYDQLDFSDLAENAKWARWVYDNPGVDTDGDEYFGEFYMCNGDTVWYEGDGIPDWRADVPPPAPEVIVIPEIGKLTIRWNGFYTENFVDPFSKQKDFEGYRVYCGLDDRKTSLSVLTSFDNENFNRFVYTVTSSGQSRWINSEPPFTLDSLRTMYGDPLFNPLEYPRAFPYEYDSVFYYFTAMDYNLSDLTDPRGIRKVYPEADDPGTDSALWSDDDITLEHGEPLPKFYEYEYVYGNLLPTVPYFVSVTAFDFGFAQGGIPSKESSVLNTLIECYAQTDADSVEAYDLDVYVYPNPYRIDADYPGHGYENRYGDEIPDRSRRIHFANLPKVCTIHIFTLDGDRVRTIRHNYPNGGPEASHDTWDMISRNVMTVESNLYYWVVESESRTQIGKFAIIR
ncbi:MAG: hypothetical protein DRP45_11475 [Candidatus Zixiibacteriota bacterium]|nr:MAG: hypothetical protein DRP45_11475 [candidate division Zixibacteria bacterium]